MTKLVHSFWTKPSLIPRYGYKCEQLFLNLWYFSLSVAYAKRIGAPIVLHTDTLGERLFGHLPYDDVKLTLDDMQAPPRFWAAGKFYAMQAEQGRAIHIDGDVFIKRPGLWERMKNSDSDLLVQYREGWLDTVVRDRLARHMSKDFFEHDCMYNTGVFGIFNEQLKKEILSTYFDTIIKAKNLPSSLLDDQNFTPDLVCEQQMVAYKSKGYKVDFLLSDWYNCREEANKIGFQHVLSSSKFRDVAKCKEVLKRVDLNIYLKTKKLCWDM